MKVGFDCQSSGTTWVQCTSDTPRNSAGNGYGFKIGRYNQRFIGNRTYVGQYGGIDSNAYGFWLDPNSGYHSFAANHSNGSSALRILADFAGDATALSTSWFGGNQTTNVINPFTFGFYGYVVRVNSNGQFVSGLKFLIPTAGNYDLSWISAATGNTQFTFRMGSDGSINLIRRDPATGNALDSPLYVSPTGFLQVPGQFSKGLLLNVMRLWHSAGDLYMRYNVDPINSTDGSKILTSADGYVRNADTLATAENIDLSSDTTGNIELSWKQKSTGFRIWTFRAFANRDFGLLRYDTSGVNLGSVLYINRTTAEIGINNGYTAPLSLGFNLRVWQSAGKIYYKNALPGNASDGTAIAAGPDIVTATLDFPSIPAGGRRN